MSLKATYTHFPGDAFFSRLILFNDFTQECPFDAFLPIDGNYTAHGFSISSAECPFLSLGALVFPDMSYTMQFVGSNSDCYSYDPVSFSIFDPALVIHSNLKNDRLPLGSLLNLQTSTADDMTTVFSQEMNAEFVSVLHSVRVSVFSGVLSATARIENNVIEMSGDSDVFGFPAHLHLSADTDSTEWDDLMFTLEGEMLPGDGSLMDALFNGVLRSLQDLAESGKTRFTLAERALNQATGWLNDTKHYYMEAETDVDSNNMSLNLALLQVNRTQERLATIEGLFISSVSEVQSLEQDLNRLCTEEFCKGVCIRGLLCGNCSIPTFTDRPIQCSRKRKDVQYDGETNEDCTLTLFNSSTPRVCCEEVDCAVRAPNASCIQADLLCRQIREVKLIEFQRAREMSMKVLQDLLEAHSNLSLAQTNANTANTRLDIAKQRKHQLFFTLQRIENATKRSINVHDQTLQEIQPLLTVGEILKENERDMHQVFNITGITFSSVFSKESPRSLLLVIAYEKPYNNMIYEDSYIYIEGLRDQNLELIVSQIIANAFSSISKRSGHFQGINRRQVSEGITRKEIFASRCVDILNTHLFFTNLQQKLEDMRESIDTSRSIESDSDPTLTENLCSESGSVGDYLCNGLADCLQTAVDKLCSLISLTPDHALHEEVLSQVNVITAAKEKALDLTVSTNLSIHEVLASIAPIVKVANAFATENYWCSDPPVMVVELPSVVNVSLGGSLRLTCEAESYLLVAYEWSKNGNVLPGFNTNELVLDNAQRLDSGNYTCFANNPVGSTESITTSISVYELPEFYLLPVSMATYFGDDNGAWFACNASAWPNPGWRWYYRASEEFDWTEIEGEDTNELLILKPQQEHEGLYTCEAFNYHGSIRANSVSLTLLPFSVSLQNVQLGFSISASTFGDDLSCSFDDLYDSVYHLVTETLGPHVSTLENFKITKVNSENYDVGFSLSSKNATTQYLHVMSFAEIANLALPMVVDLHKNVDAITMAFSREVVRSIGQANEYSISPGSFVVEKLTYICPEGQRLNSDDLLCCKLYKTVS